MTSLSDWSRDHGDYDVSRSALVRGWLRLMSSLAARLEGVPPAAVTGAGVALAGGAALVAGRSRWRRRIAAVGVLAAALCDGLDGAVARRQGVASRRGAALLDTTADRLGDGLFLVALRRAGAPRLVVRAAGLGTAVLEARRALGRRRSEPVTVITPGERPMRVGYAALGLVVAPTGGAAVTAAATAAGVVALGRPMTSAAPERLQP